MADRKPRFLVVFVRHAKAGSRRAWEGDDRLRPLTSAGKKQANRLVGILEDVSIKRILSSPYRRCVETVEPLAQAQGLEVEVNKALAEGMGVDAFLALIDKMADDAVYCGHADLALELLKPLVDGRLIKPQAARYEKGSTWILERRKGSFTSATYLPPP